MAKKRAVNMAKAACKIIGAEELSGELTLTQVHIQYRDAMAT